MFQARTGEYMMSFEAWIEEDEYWSLLFKQSVLPGVATPLAPVRKTHVISKLSSGSSSRMIRFGTLATSKSFSLKPPEMIANTRVSNKVRQ